MTQLANLALWAQILSLGGFMFAGGFSMSRFPLVPIIILSFFYSYGIFTQNETVPTFILQQLWPWTIVHSILLIFCIIIGILIYAHSMNMEAIAGGIEAGILCGLIMIAWGLLVAISFVPALIKWIHLLKSLPGFYWQTILYCALFVIGIVIGVYSIWWWWHGPISFSSSFILPIVICFCNLWTIHKGYSGTGIIAGSLSGISILILLYFLCENLGIIKASWT